ncbi:hypothetical protein FNV43_RR22445 [Rhamnella rubrinervis]|uniref:Pentatricopeptide repeat-containing protein n=1 Tax=Rhamnella rubrinervis TaxID=2594499 RepID=A0A8K0GS27_9ROSA|nr:hypothetical protein FNV43_RR22445 [Rhamnella rubrinervis]
MYLNTLRHLSSAIRSISNHKPVSKTTINLSVLKTPFDQCRDFKEFKQILFQVILTGFIKDTFAAKRLLEFSTDYFSTFIHLDYSYQIFNVIENPDASIYNIMMMAYVDRSYPHRAIPFYKLMLNRNVDPNGYTYPFLVEACAVQKSVFEGIQKHNHVLKLGFESDVDVRSTFVDMYADCSMLDDACKIFYEGPMMGSFVWLCCFEEYDKLLNEIPKNDTDSWSDLIYSFKATNREMYEEALELFIRMHGCGITIDELVLYAVLPCCTKLARFVIEVQDVEMMGKLIHSLIRMMRSGIRLDENDFCNILAYLPYWHEALDLGKCIHAYLIKYGYGIKSKLRCELSDMYSSCGCKVMRDEREDTIWQAKRRFMSVLRCSYGESYGVAKGTPKSVLKTRKSEFNGILDDDETPVPDSPEDASQPSNIDFVAESNCEASAKQSCKGPRMPDGTRGLTMGRGKPLSTPTVVATSPME